MYEGKCFSFKKMKKKCDKCSLNSLTQILGVNGTSKAIFFLNRHKKKPSKLFYLEGFTENLCGPDGNRNFFTYFNCFLLIQLICI